MPILIAGNSLADSIAEAIDSAGDLIVSGFETAPALVLGLGAIAVLPLLIVAGMILRRAAAPEHGAQTAKVGRTTRIRGWPLSPDAQPTSREKSPVPAYSQAVIAIEADEGSDAEGIGEEDIFRFGSAIIARIGREEDNDIRLKHPTVHRYHALIQRNFEEGYEIADLSDAAGNGVMVNGKRVSNAPLADGDVISLGAARLRFGLPT